MRVLIIEDEVNLALPLVALLEKNKILADTVADGTSGLMLARKPVYDVIVLDIMLPEIDGFTILKTLREEHNNTPILLLTALDNIDDRVKGLNLGADDYLTKPFDTKELIARIKALSRRGSGSITEEVLHIGNVSLNVNNASLSIGDREETLTKKEANLLETLMKNKDNVLSKDYILDKVWGIDSYAIDNSVEIYIHYLRKKLGSDADVKIVTNRGLGYTLKEKDNA
ncbi:response regulator transcription factor [Anaerofustis stercorihominis]|uniref:Stage 0 sporulation protein A homolog n=1 Tax=Anaerofustis stercorihominis DSM 17244 TaxID=445971 RepID=B1C8W4_9FIRM|nr:response regulator transcription factor [Anaerofustis stercorihominis]EDS72024.1 response regulator receiver domain protein [Anaerofustis stercorihominis DSM 17244]MCQ4795925.1 response regulator transcription factor [Anaerofustis stercorihominis]